MGVPWLEAEFRLWWTWSATRFPQFSSEETRAPSSTAPAPRWPGWRLSQSRAARRGTSLLQPATRNAVAVLLMEAQGVRHGQFVFARVTHRQARSV